MEHFLGIASIQDLIERNRQKLISNTWKVESKMKNGI